MCSEAGNPEGRPPRVAGALKSTESKGWEALLSRHIATGLSVNGTPGAAPNFLKGGGGPPYLRFFAWGWSDAGAEGEAKRLQPNFRFFCALKSDTLIQEMEKNTSASVPITFCSVWPHAQPSLVLCRFGDRTTASVSDIPPLVSRWGGTTRTPILTSYF